MKKVAALSAFAGLSGVGLGAFGAHALRATLVARGTVDTWQTATLYHLFHAVALLAATVAVAQTIDERVARRWRVIAVLWTSGIVLFSGSLYALALGAPKWMGPITPLGGLAFLVGWFLVALTCQRPSR